MLWATLGCSGPKAFSQIASARSGADPRRFEQRPKSRSERPQELNGQSARETVSGRLGAVDIGGNHAKKSIVEEKREGCCPVDDPRFDDLTACTVAFVAVVAGAGLAANQQLVARGIGERTAHPPPGASLDNVDQRLAHRCRYLGREDFSPASGLRSITVS